MRLGLGISEDLPLAQQQVLARDVEEAGLASLWTNEASGRDALMLCQAWAAATTTLEVGVGIVPVWTRTPAQLAMAAATLQEASSGRFLLGLGVSHPATMATWHGASYRQPLAAARETLTLLRAILAGERTDHGGEVVSSTRFQLAIDSLPPPPRLYLAAMGPRMLALAGGWADGVLLNWSSPAGIRRAAAAVRGAAAGSGAGRPPALVELAAYVRVAIDADRDAAREALAREMYRYLRLPAYARHLRRQGLQEEVEEVERAHRDGGPKAAVAAVPEGMLQQLGWYGTPDDSPVAPLGRYVTAGLDHLVARVVVVGDDPAASVRAVIGALRDLPLSP
ncbi:MAG TPA: LLM class flavin-dependent oxidoreductase [Nitriliruptorales bacterium]|nr:LLM class flavin-dependent oxidoreductase [Nitriliruptorales bacterium]